MERDIMARIRRSALAGGMFGMLIVSTMMAQTTTAARSRAKDPGPRPNPESTIPNPVPGLSDNETALFNESLLRVSELEGTCDTCSQQPQGGPPTDPDPNNSCSPLKLWCSAGVRAVLNAEQCCICHSQPVIGGSSPAHNPAEKIAHR